LAIFIEYPYLASVVGALLLLVARWKGSRTATVVGCLWLLYSAYELGMKQRWLCSGECNIRIDLLLIYPVLLLAAAVAVVSLFWPPRSR
jgi:mRNA-degrading endonuclease YafQ of YafQ-DinJ toxin-antitoxin module